MLVKSSALLDKSAVVTSTPSFYAMSFIYDCFLILPMLDSDECMSAKAPKFGMFAASVLAYSCLWSAAAIPSSIAFWAIAILALASSTVSKWPSSSSCFTGSTFAGSVASYYCSSIIFCSTAASPYSSIACIEAASTLASATVWICSPFSSTVGFSLASFSALAFLSN